MVYEWHEEGVVVFSSLWLELAWLIQGGERGLEDWIRSSMECRVNNMLTYLLCCLLAYLLTCFCHVPLLIVAINKK